MCVSLDSCGDIFLKIGLYNITGSEWSSSACYYQTQCFGRTIF